MSKLFHYAFHVANSPTILKEMNAFYKNVLGADANINESKKKKHGFANVFNTILAFEPEDNSRPITKHKLDFFGIPAEKMNAIRSYCEENSIAFKENFAGDVYLNDPAGNEISLTKNNSLTNIQTTGLTVHLTTTDLKATKEYYQSNFKCPISELKDRIIVNFYGHEIEFKKADIAISDFVADKDSLLEAQKTDLVSTQHFGISNFTKEEIDSLILNFNSNSGFQIQPKIANRGTEFEQIFGFVKDSNGYTLELRYIKNPDSTIKNIDKMAQQNIEVKKERYYVINDTSAILYQYNQPLRKTDILESNANSVVNLETSPKPFC
jgi:extradiol dioxygenase family protein